MQSRTNDQPTSTSLIRGARRKHDDAWAELVSKYSPPIYNHCRSLGLLPDESADTTQEVLATAFVQIERFRREKETDSLRKWLAGITRNKVREYFRRRRQQLATGAGGSQAYGRLLQLGTFEESGAAARHLDSNLMLRRALTVIEDDFQAHTWKAFWRTAIDNQSSTAVASELKMTAESVRQAKARVMRRLRDELERMQQEQ